MTSFTPQVSVNFERTTCCQQVTCCSRNVSNNLDMHRVVYNESDGELQNEPPRKTSCLDVLMALIACCSPSRRAEQREENEKALQQINVYLVQRFKVTAEDAAKECSVPLDTKKRTRGPITVRELAELQASAEAIFQRRSGTSVALDESVGRSSAASSARKTTVRGANTESIKRRDQILERWKATASDAMAQHKSAQEPKLKLIPETSREA
ncbi:MAG: hypothetical protein ACKVOH_06045 [Chlamydiales bacterium]